MNTELILQSADVIIEIMNQKSDSWNKGIYSITARPTRSISFMYPQDFKDIYDNKIESEYFTLSNSAEFIAYFKSLNTQQKINKLTFYFEDRKYIRFELSWDQSVQDEFEQGFPESLKKEIKAWYLPNQEPAKEPAQKQILPKSGVQMDSTVRTTYKAF